MRLEITYLDDAINLDFANWVRDLIKSKIKASIDNKKLIRWDDYLNKDGVLTFTYLKKITAKDVIMLGVNNIMVYSIPNKFLICINPNKFVDGLHLTKVETLCKLINYGNSEMKGYPIFSEVFTDFETNFSKYLELYFMTINRKGEFE